ncbi:MAG: HAMP domain-containing histidine kinase [Lachnospiraceae bacterium]|nr:HAMP domain-containing histidine kinase [Lachnospiraceae bacterium]
MKKLLFTFLFILCMASVSAAAFFGFGVYWLSKNELLWADETLSQKAVQRIMEEGDRLEQLGDETGIPFMTLAMAVDGEDVKADAEKKLAKVILYKVMDEGWDAANSFCDKYEIKYKIYHVLGRSWGGNLKTEEEKDTPKYTVSYYNDKTGKREGEYVIYVGLDLNVLQPLVDENYKVRTFWILNRYGTLVGAVISGVVSLGLIIAMFLMGKRKREASFGVDKIPLEIFIASGAGVFYSFFRDHGMSPLYQKEVAPFLAKWFVAEFLLLALLVYVLCRLRQKEWHKDTLVYLCITGICKTARAWVELAKNMAFVWKMFWLEIAITFLEAFVIVAILTWSSEALRLMAALFILKILLIPWIMQYGIAIGKIQKAAAELASGDFEQTVNTEELPRSLKDLGENVNALAGSVSSEVEQRMKSERLKTELITNVSHDIKTPLTSIINFSDLIQKEEAGSEKVQEYAEHLHRQSVRLKKLLEDLMEASKATTGNLEVHLAPCDARVLLGQCLGEYEARLKEKGLELVIKQSEEPLRIMADPRMLLRVFDNLIGNICKYAQKDTRVYLSAERAADNARISFKNVSKYALDVAPEELLERFVRGDLSRHTEGNGLGLSIVSSLMELQGGKISLDADADLFKVTLEFPLAPDGGMV